MWNGGRYSRALKRDRMALYLPMAQVPDTVPGALLIRPRGDPQAFLTHARSIAQAVRPDLPAVKAIVIRDLVAPELRPWRLGATVFSAFALVALLLASTGLYGVVALGSALRVKEIGIRMALGAGRTQVIWVVISEGMPAVVGGLVVGAVGALTVSRWLAGVLFETSAQDPAILIQSAVTLLTISMVAVIVPTIRALSTNPASALRAD